MKNQIYFVKLRLTRVFLKLKLLIGPKNDN